MIPASAETWSYDAAGNLLDDGTTTSTSDALNRLTQQDGTSYGYNGDGVLVTAGATTYAQDLAAPLSQVISDGSTSYLYGDQRLAALGQAWYIGDALGSVRQTLDGSGAVLAATGYDPWGTPQQPLTTPFGFTGELHGQDRVHLRARWYDPGNGTFTSRDPFAGVPTQPYSLHPYQYAYSAPTTWTDPTGECVGWIWGDPTCQFIGWNSVQQGDLNYADATPWAGAGADFIPVVGDVKGFIEVFTGCDLITGEDLGAWRWAGLVPLAGPRLRKARMLRLFADVTWLSKYGENAYQAPLAFSLGPRGEELASPELLAAVQRKGRIIFQDAETQRLLDYFQANASSDGINISLRPDPRKIEVLEEFLHGTQRRLGIPDRMSVAEYERHVKDFMIRHRRLLGISDQDASWLIQSMEMYK